MKRNSELICKTSHQGSDEDPLTSAIDAKDVEILRLNQLIHLKVLPPLLSSIVTFVFVEW